MRRIDRILFSALGHGINENATFSNDNDMEEMSAAKTTVQAPAQDTIVTSDEIIPEANSEFEADASKNINCQDDGFKDTSSSVTLAAIKDNEIVGSDVESPAAPLYSPLTPLVTMQKTTVVTCNNSPIPPMSPSTLELLKTLSEDLSSEEQDYTDFSKRRHSNGVSDSNLQEDGDFDDDTESDDVPDSGSETDASYSSIKQKSRMCITVPESDSSDNETTTEDFIQNTVAMVHVQTRTDRTTQITHNESPSIVTNTAQNDITIGEIISMCQDSDIEAVHPVAEATHPITESNDALQTMGRSKRGRKRKYPEYCLSEKKDRKYMNLFYHIKDKVVKSKEYSDYTCTCQQRCHLLVSTETRKQEFDKFIALGSYEAQLLFILSNVKESKKARSYTSTKSKTGKKKPRQYRRHYYICKNVVCKQMFLKTFQISSKKVDICLNKKRLDETYNDKRGRKQGGWNKTPEEDIDFVRNVINSLPKYESHYRRERNNGTQYLK